MTGKRYHESDEEESALAVSKMPRMDERGESAHLDTDNARQFIRIKISDEAAQRIYSEREISQGSFDEATLTFINIDVTATRAVVVFADCHRKLLPSFVSSKELIDDLEKILPGEAINIVGMKAEPRSEIYFKYLNGRVQLLFFNETQFTLHKPDEGSSEALQPTSIKELSTGINQFVCFHRSRAFRSIYYVLLIQYNEKRCQDSTLSFKKMFFTDFKGDKLELFVGDKLMDKVAHMKIDEVYHLHGVSIEESTYASQPVKVNAMTYIFRTSTVEYTEWTTLVEKIALVTAATASAIAHITLADLKKNPKLAENEIKLRGVVSNTPFKDHFAITDGSEDDYGALLKLSVTARGARALKFDTLEVFGRLDEMQVLDCSNGFKKVDPNDNDKTVIKKIKEGKMQVNIAND